VKKEEKTKEERRVAEDTQSHEGNRQASPPWKT
jgi:hypothetical protein